MTDRYPPNLLWEICKSYSGVNRNPLYRCTSITILKAQEKKKYSKERGKKLYLQLTQISWELARKNSCVSKEIISKMISLNLFSDLEAFSVLYISMSVVLVYTAARWVNGWRQGGRGGGDVKWYTYKRTVDILGGEF